MAGKWQDDQLGYVNSLIKRLEKKRRIYFDDIATIQKILEDKSVKKSIEAKNRLVNVLKRNISQIPTPNFYIHSLELLGDIGTNQATEAILEFLRNSNDSPEQREFAVRALGRTKNPIAVPALINALYDEDDEVSWFAAISIPRIPGVPIAKLLGFFIDSRYHSTLYSRLREALERIGTPIIPYVIPILIDKESDIQLRRRLAGVLVKITLTEQAIPGLLAIMDDTDEDYRSIRQDAVDKLGELKAVPALVSLLESLADGAMKIRITGRLREIGTLEALRAIEDWQYSQRKSDA